jgi:predicted anti-sigma-YlaC factor YlaD
MLNCHEATRLLSESQERTLDLQERISLKMHVMMCSGCRNFGQQMHTLRQMARAYAKGADERVDKPDD